MNPFAAARHTAAIVATAGLALLAAACGGSPASHVAQLGSTTTTSSSAASAEQKGALAFARCMRAHGVPSFPDPDPQGKFPPFHAGVSKQTSLAANDDCKHLFPSGGGTATPEQRREKFTFALEVAGCLRTHGYPSFPDPTASGQAHLGVDTDSPQFQTAESNCEKQSRKALGLP